MRRSIGSVLVSASLVAGFCLFPFGQAAGAAGGAVSLYLATGQTFDPLDGMPAAPPTLQAGALMADQAGVFIVQFDKPVGDAERSLVAAAAGSVIAYLPDYAFLVRMTPEARDLLSPSARWIGRWEPAYKISPLIGSHQFWSEERRDDPLLTLRVRVFDDLSGAAVKIEELGADLLDRVDDPFQKLVIARIEPDLLESIARLEEVWWIEELPEYKLMNNTTKWVVQSNLSGQTPAWDRGLHGEGEIVFLMDSGLDYNSCWFRDTGSPPPGPGHRKVMYYQTYGGGELYDGCDPGHGTHVAGTVAGDQSFINPGNTNYNGMAYAAKLGMQDVQANDEWTCLTGSVTPPTSLTGAYTDAYNQGARVHTNSWGGSENAYDAYCVNIDAFMASHRDFLILFAAGNAGSGAGTVGYPGTAKNCITVGATRQAPQQNTIAGYSSRGPAFDSRYKPTVTAPGGEAGYAYINSVNNHTGNPPSNTCAVQGDPFQGTSMATPAVAGIVALARQYFREGWYPGGIAGSGPSINPSAALLKAMVLNSGTDMGTADIPNNNEGWGRVKIDDALYFDGDSRELRIEDEGSGISTGGFAQFTYDVEAGESFEAVLVWTDVAASSGAGVAIVNDLDLTVTGPSGTFRGNVFSGGASVTGGNYDRRNVEEVVRLASPAAGSYTVRVEGYNVPSGPQKFALALTGAFADGPSVDPGLPTTAVNDDLMLSPDGNGDSTMTIVVTVLDGGGAPYGGIPAGGEAVAAAGDSGHRLGYAF